MTTPAWNCFRSPLRISETAMRGNNATENRVVNSRNCPLFIQALAFFDEMIEQRSSSAAATSRTSGDVRLESAKKAKADIGQVTNRDFMSTRRSRAKVRALRPFQGASL